MNFSIGNPPPILSFARGVKGFSRCLSRCFFSLLLKRVSTLTGVSSDYEREALPRVSDVLSTCEQRFDVSSQWGTGQLFQIIQDLVLAV
jgi:hypothetical protein